MLGMTGEPDRAEAAALITGRELLAVGINMNLAPVVDVNSNPRNPVIGDRSFGSDPEVVIAYGAKALSGYRQAGIISTLKHFPGHGDVEVDSHEDLPIVSKSKEALERCELLPFAKLEASADAMMTAHIFVPALDPEHCATLSEKTLTYLRNTIGFQGAIVADSLVMGGILKQVPTVDEAAIRALQAGCDILLLGGRLLNGEQVELTASDVQRIHSSIVQAVQTGRVSEARLNQAVERILKLKFDHQPVDSNRALRLT
jgi:beta-N-acetylhexosaminidase